MIIGITGGSGCGKTTLLRAVEDCGGLALDCDAIYHRLLQTDDAMRSAIEARFPGTVCRGTLDRKKLGALVFGNESALLALNAITHAAVKAEVLRLLEPEPALGAIDAIGLFEGGLAELCTVTVAVTAPEEARVRRLTARDGISEDYARARLAAQKSGDWYRAHCGYVLENDGSEQDFHRKCLAFLRQFGIMKRN